MHHRTPSPPRRVFITSTELGALLRPLLLAGVALFLLHFMLAPSPLTPTPLWGKAPARLPKQAQRLTPPLVIQAADSTIALENSPIWSSNDADGTHSIAWGDVDRDGDLDLAVGNGGGDASGAPNKLYLNQGGILQVDAAWTSQENDITFSIAWGDVDGDGDLDLAAGNWGFTRVYLNEGGMLQSKAAWSTPVEDSTQSVAWGDVDGDGDLDLALGNGYFGDTVVNKVYFNQGGSLENSARWVSSDSDDTTSVAWGDLDHDGDLDLAVGNAQGGNKVYYNRAHTLEITATWVSSDTDDTQSVAWGDVNGDGYVDLAAGNYGQPNKVYLYHPEFGALATTAEWLSVDPDGNYVSSIAWGDMDGDGDLDLAAGNKLYRNLSTGLEQSATWTTVDPEVGDSVAWGDMDGDGDLDLALGNSGTDAVAQPNQVYRNSGGTLQQSADAVRKFGSDDEGLSVSWGDVDGDGDLDLAVGNRGADRVYRNDGGVLQSVVWNGPATDVTYALAWGDVDGDGDLDLATGNLTGANKLYRNNGGTLESTAAWVSSEQDRTTSVAWGDVDNDGDLDLIAGTEEGPNRLYLNQGGVLEPQAHWSFGAEDDTYSVVWGDVDGDGDLDLVVGNNAKYDNVNDREYGGENKLYRNHRGQLEATPIWQAQSDDGDAIALGDVDGDGDLDLAVGDWGLNRVYLNIGGIFEREASWFSADADATEALAWGDLDGDGDLDLVAGNYEGSNKYYQNLNDRLNPNAVWVSADDIQEDITLSIALGDVDDDGDLDLAASTESVYAANQLYLNQRPAELFFPGEQAAIVIDRYSAPLAAQPTNRALALANDYATAGIRSGPIPFTYTLFQPASQPMQAIYGYYSLDGGGQWFTATGTLHNPSTGNPLATAPYPQRTVTNTHRFEWDLFADGIFGQSDHVLFRLEARPDLSPVRDGVAGPYQRPFFASQTYPFRIRGTQVQVLANESMGPGAPNALVYRLPQGQTRDGHLLTDNALVPLRTDSQGFLQGQGRIATGDRLVALWPISATTSYTRYATSAQPVLSGLAAYTVTQPGLQQLLVSPLRPLLLFNLTVALEWDARKDTKFLNDLQFDLQRTSELLYDWSNGQAALGNITIYHDKAHWLDADIRIHATNRLRPHATIGGIVAGLQLETITRTVPSGGSAIRHYLYTPGQVEMGATWNRYGEAGESQSDDWSRTLAHELGHYLFYLHDNYIGLDGDHIIRLESCPGVMSDPYRELNSEFHPPVDWLRDCTLTFANQQVGRSDWATIVHFYPWLQMPKGAIDNALDAGPNLLPLAVTQIHFAPVITQPATVAVPSFSLSVAGGGRYRASSQARAFLFQSNRLVDLGAPRQDQLQAWNARPGDRVCVYDRAAEPQPLIGCQVVLTGDEEMALAPHPDWQPDVVIIPGSTHTITVQVNNVTAGLDLRMRLYPANAPISAAAPPEFALSPTANGGYSGVISTELSTLAAYLHLYVAGDPIRSTVTDYTLGGAPALVLSEGDALVLSEGDILKKSDGSVLVLSEGDIVALSQGSILIRRNDGTVLVLSEGDTLVLSEGDTVVHNGAALVLSEGDTLVVAQGAIQIRRTNGDVIVLQHGDTLTLQSGSALVLSEGDVAIWQSNNNVLVLSEGDALILSEGDTLYLNNGGALVLSEGDALVLSEGDATLTGQGEALVLSEGDAPIRSGDGQVTLYGDALNFPQGEFYTLQPATQIPQEPVWATVVGHAYRVTASPNAPALTGASISFNYIGRDVADDKEHLLTIYFWNGAEWEALPTTVDDYHNTAVAGAKGVGIYMLMYSIDLPLSGQGWDPIGYPIQGARAITTALQSIEPYYALVYTYDPFEPDPLQRWQVYGHPPVPEWVNTLHQLEFGHSYWISATHETSLTLRLKDVTDGEITIAAARTRVATVGLPLPATYYGAVQASADFTPTAGLTVTARIDGNLCGMGQTAQVENRIVYSVIVLPATPGATAGCGAPGRTVEFVIGDQAVLPTAAWDNDRIHPHELNRADIGGTGAITNSLYLPFVQR